MTRTFRTKVHEGPYSGEFFVTLDAEAIEIEGNDLIKSKALQQARRYMTLPMAAVWVEILEEIEDQTSY